MKFTHNNIPLLSLALAAATNTAEAGTLTPPKHIFANPPSSSSSSSAGHRVPTSYESAIMGRRILALTPLGNLATVFPSSSSSSSSEEDEYNAAENRPDGLGGMPHAMMEYVADCEGEGNPTFLAIDVETTFKNVRDGSNVSLAQQWTPPFPPDKRIRSTRPSSSSSSSSSSSTGLLSKAMGWLGLDYSAPEEDPEPEPAHDTVPYSAANLPRFSLLGYVEKIPLDADGTAAAALSECFVDRHPDARYWLPGSRVHRSDFVRLVVQQVYWVGGFGDRAYIGWIPVDEWRSVRRAEWEAIRLPGEKKGWKEWSVGAGEL